jgi:hypothetical protein
MSYPKNSATPPSISATVVKASDGSAITTGVAAKVTVGSAAQTDGGGTIAHSGLGEWKYAPLQAETNAASFAVKFYHADAVATGPTCSVVTDDIAANLATLLSRIVGTLLAGNHTAQTGDAYAVVNNGTYGNSALQTILTSTGVPLTSGERTTLAAAIEAAIINELDGKAVMQAIADLIAGDMTTGDLSVQAIASAVRDAILNRVLAGNHDTTGTPGKLMQSIDAAISSRAPASTALDKTTWTDTKAGYLDAAISSRGTGTALDAAGVRNAVGLGAANLDTQLGNIPTVSEMEARTILAAAYGTAANQTAIAAAIVTVDTVVDALAVEVAKIPRSGKTYKWTNADNSASVDLTVGEA